MPGPPATATATATAAGPQEASLRSCRSHTNSCCLFPATVCVAMDHFTACGLVHFRRDDTWFVGTSQLRQAYRAIGLAFVDDSRFMRDRGAITTSDLATLVDLKHLRVIKARARKASIIEVRGVHHSNCHPIPHRVATHASRPFQRPPLQPHKVLDFLLLERGIPLPVVPKLREMPDTRSMAAAHVSGEEGLSVGALAPTAWWCMPQTLNKWLCLVKWAVVGVGVTTTHTCTFLWVHLHLDCGCKCTHTLSLKT